MEIRSSRPGDEAAILELFRASYSRELPRSIWEWRFQGAPAGPGAICLACDGDRLAAHYAVTPAHFILAGRDVITGLSGTTMTHPDYRGGGLFPKLARATYEEMQRRGMAMVWGFPNTQSHRGFVRDLGWRDIWEIPTFRLHLPVARSIEPNIDVLEQAASREQLDELWNDVRAQHHVAAVRDGRWIAWRYLQNPVERYRILTTYRGSTLAGYAVLKRYKDEVHIVDLLARDHEIELALAHAAVARAVAESAAAVSLWLSPYRPLHVELERLGFQNEAPVTYLGARILDPALAADAVDDYRHWYVTMGDSDVY